MGLAAANYVVAILAVVFLVVQPIAADDDLSPLASPYLQELCKEVECGKGTCKSSLDYDFNFICECDPGWKRTRFENKQEQDLKYLPCVIPNCTLDYSCTGAPSPAPVIPDLPRNKSFYDPCFYAYCGEGTCSKSLKKGYTCECKQGFTNLLNITAFPCYNQCVLGNDCASLGITVAKGTTNSTSPSGNSGNHGSSSLPGSFVWLTILIMSVAMVSRT